MLVMMMIIIIIHDYDDHGDYDDYDDEDYTFLTLRNIYCKIDDGIFTTFANK